MSESQISNDIRKQREKEMNVVLGRFNRQIEPTSSNEQDTNSPLSQKSNQYMTPPPPAPPMPNNLFGSQQRAADSKSYIKRKSNGLCPIQLHLFFKLTLTFYRKSTRTG